MPRALRDLDGRQTLHRVLVGAEVDELQEDVHIGQEFLQRAMAPQLQQGVVPLDLFLIDLIEGWGQRRFRADVFAHRGPGPVSAPLALCFGQSKSCLSISQEHSPESNFARSASSAWR